MVQKCKDAIEKSEFVCENLKIGAERVRTARRKSSCSPQIVLNRFLLRDIIYPSRTPGVLFNIFD